MISVHAFNAHPKHKVRLKETLRLARQVLRAQGSVHIVCNIIFIDDKRMTDLNGRYLNRTYVTDVLSFPLGEKDRAKIIEGEVYVNLDQARRQAREYRVIIKHEVARLVIHGLLHLLGYRDVTKRERERMTEIEDLYLKRS